MVATMILAAGLGTRLRPLSALMAKPLVPVGDRPAIAHVLDAVRGVASRVVVNSHHRPLDLRAFAESSGISVSHEPDLLGTAGGLAHAAALLGDGDVLVWNGDILAEIDAAALVRAHENGSAQATLAVRPGPRGTGNVGIDASGLVVRLRKETVRDGEREEAAGGEFLGIHVVGRSLRETLPRSGCLVGDVYLPALRTGARLGAFDVTGPFWDIGTLASYLDANRAWLARRGLASWVAKSAHVARGAALTEAVVGEGARVSGSLSRVVVWPGAEVTSDLKDAIVTPGGVAQVDSAVTA